MAARVTHEQAYQALRQIMWELPAEFDTPLEDNTAVWRESFTVIKRSNVRKVWEGIQTLCEYFIQDENDGNKSD